MEIERGKLPPPPGLIASLARGFDTVAGHILVILPPVLLDLFLWLGPHLRLDTLRPQFLQAMTRTPGGVPVDQINAVYAQVDKFFQGFNLFSALRTFPVGTPSLLSLQLPLQTPLGLPVSLDAGSFLGAFGWILLLALAGWVLGAVYYYWVSKVTFHSEARFLGKSLFHAVLLSIIWLTLLLVMGMPSLLVISLLTLLNPALGQVALIAGAIILIWLVIPMFFSVHGIFTMQLDAFRSIMNGLQMVRFTLPNTTLFLFAFLLINEGLGVLWRTPQQNSWWMLVGIAGHAFISTALLAASFIYYRDINAWLKVVFEQLKMQASSAKA